MSDNEAFNKCTTDASTRGDFVAEANAKSAAALWLAYCEKKMELETAQERIETLEAALQSLVGCVQMVRDNAEHNGHKHQHCVTYNLWSALCKQVKLAHAALAGEKQA